MTVATLLSPKQQQIVEQPVETPAILVDAGPGSGKTRVLGERIRWLIANEIDPRAIVALTFTQQAARELRNRLSNISTDVRAQTIHSYAHHLIREHGKAWGRSMPVQVIANQDQARCLQRVFIDTLGWDCPESHASNLLKQISHRKRLGLEIGQHHYLFGYGHSQLEVEQIDTAYCLANHQANALDFDDLISEAAQGLRGDQAIASEPIWLFIDEFHDISLDQYELIRLLAPPAAPEARLFAIWDRRQSIYRFRGADTQRVAANLYADYQPLLLKMKDNYRSTSNVVRIANALLPLGKSPELNASREEVGQVVEIECRDEMDEAQSIVQLVQRRIAEGDSPGSIAVLYAKHERGDRIERLLSREGVVIRRVLGRSLSSQGALRGLETLLRLASGRVPEQHRLQALSVELGPLLDEFDWLALETQETGCVITPASSEGLLKRVTRFNDLIERISLLPGSGTLQQLGDAIIDEMARARASLSSGEFEEMVVALRASGQEARDDLLARAAVYAGESIPDRSYVAIDVETTSKYVESAEIFDVAAIRFDASGNPLEAPFTAVVRGLSIPPSIRTLTRITQDEIDGGIDMHEALSGLRDWIRPDDVLVGHALADFDLPVINRHFLMHGLDPFDNEVLDTLPLARRLYPDQSRRLEDLSASFGFPERPHHRALPDVEATIDLFRQIVEDRRWRMAITAIAEREEHPGARQSYWEEVREQWRRILDLAPREHDLADVLSMMALTTDDICRDSDDAVHMMTIHASKGLEWDTVILAGIEDDLFPFGLNPSSEEIDEAQRLLYVGVTRAKDRLAIFHVLHRDGVPKSPSRFLSALPDDPNVIFRRRLGEGHRSGGPVSRQA